jgi:transcriptional regulator with XRE-family HTH domain
MNERPPGPKGGRTRLHSVPDPSSGDELGFHLGEQLKKARERSGLTQDKAAARSGLTRKTIAEHEKARFPNPRLSTLLRLMLAYELRSLEELLGPTPSARLAAEWEEEDWEGVRDSG